MTGDRYRANYGRVFGKRRAGGGRRVYFQGRWYDLNEAPAIRERDSINIVSTAAGVHPDQVPEMMEKYGHLGVKFDPEGNAVFRNRNSKLACLRAWGMHDRDEVRG